jgi:hypothetical protein
LDESSPFLTGFVKYFFFWKKNLDTLGKVEKEQLHISFGRPVSNPLKPFSSVILAEAE